MYCREAQRGAGNRQGILNDVLSTYKQYRSNVRYPLARSKRVFDSGKVTDHHAIIPTGKASHSLSEKEAKVYDLIDRRFIAVFCGDCTFLSTAVTAHAGNIPFKTTGERECPWAAGSVVGLALHKGYDLYPLPPRVPEGR